MSRSVPPSSFLRQPLDTVLTGVGSLRVLRVLARHGGELTVSRIAAETGLSDQGVRNALSQAEEAGIVRAVGSGRSWVYRLTRTALALALNRLFEAEAARHERVLAVAKEALGDARIAAAWLFGSAARGEDGPHSDLDLAVVLDAPEAEAAGLADELRERLRTASERLSVAFSVVALDPHSVARMIRDDAPLWRDILRDAVTITGPDPRSYARRSKVTA